MTKAQDVSFGEEEMKEWAKDVGEQLKMNFCVALNLLNYILLNLSVIGAYSEQQKDRSQAIKAYEGDRIMEIWDAVTRHSEEDLRTPRKPFSSPVLVILFLLAL